MAKRIMLVVNPAGGRGKSIDLLPKLEKQLVKLGLTTDIRITENPGQATKLAAKAAQCGYKRIAAVGGDGTVNMVAAGVYGTDTTLAVIPAGTGNDFFKMLNIESNFEEICQAAAFGEAITLDVGIFNDRPFFNMLGVGFDAQVGIEANKTMRNLGIVTYLKAVYKVLKNYQSHDIKLRIDSLELERDILLVAVGIGRSTGGGFLLTPQAITDDGKFDVCLATSIGKMRIMSLLPKVLKGKHIRAPEVSMYRCKQLEIFSDKPLPVHYEGETFTTTNGKLSIKMSRHKLKVASGVKQNK
ncbi:MAG: diacylglycerol kinase family lipid kinase [candidate division Zixibacteria bacterium]|nr:diacylglycerol kinase family lipid kinase [candidate division Zixibacteria bacterium]